MFMIQYRFTLLFLILAGTLTAQDRHFTQFYASPLTLNPALTGAFDGKYRVGAIYRDQWSGILDQPYQTFSLGADLRFSPFKNNFDKDKIGVGLLFYRDQINGVDFNSTQIALSGAYHKSLDYNSTHYLSLGFQFGLNQRNVNYENLTFQDQFNGTDGYTRPTQEPLPENNFSYGDFSAGLNYAAAPKGGTAFFAGVAMHHFNKPNISFYSAAAGIPPNKLFVKYSAQMSLQIPLSSQTSFSPRLLVASQGPSLEANVGANFKFTIDKTYGTSLHLGSWVRPVKSNNGFGLDAVVLLAGIEYNSVLFGFSYDLNLPTLSTFKRYQNTFEISLIYLGEYENDELLCPEF